MFDVERFLQYKNVVNVTGCRNVRHSPQLQPGETLRKRGRLTGAERWDELLAHFPGYRGIRQIILASIHLVQTSCGYGVPLMELQKDRETLARWATSQGEEGLVDYRGAHNSKSLDGLPTPLAQHYRE